jgi:DNA (cytosine-5)-methyltransferase 1
MRPLNHLSLFSGIGGIDLAAEWAGFHTVGFCEKDAFCRKVLAKHWPDVPIWEDVKDVTRESLESRGIGRIDLITGGFPCQPLSRAGKRKGQADDRFLWPEMLRVIGEVRPRWVVAENVDGMVELALDTVLSELEGLSYEVGATVLPACAVGAIHRRERVFIVGWRTYTCRYGQWTCTWQADPEVCDECSDADCYEESEELFRCSDEYEAAAIITDTTGKRIRGMWTKGEPKLEALARPVLSKRLGDGFGQVEPDLRRVVHGVPNRVDRLRALGNAVVPQQVYPILKAIAGIEEVINAKS